MGALEEVALVEHYFHSSFFYAGYLSFEEFPSDALKQYSVETEYYSYMHQQIRCALLSHLWVQICLLQRQLADWWAVLS